MLMRASLAGGVAAWPAMSRFVMVMDGVERALRLRFD